MDSAAIQSMHWSFMLWPSLLLTLAVLLPLSAACNWLKRNVRFSLPQFGAAPATPVAPAAPAAPAVASVYAAAAAAAARSVQLPRGGGRGGEWNNVNWRAY